MGRRTSGKPQEAELCTLCGGVGWDNKGAAHIQRVRLQQQLRHLALTDSRLAERHLYRCELGLWHVAAELVLPAAPPLGSANRVQLVTELLVAAIEEQGPGLVLPSMAILQDRYRLRTDRTRTVRLALVEGAWLRRHDLLYVTKARAARNEDDQ